MKFVRTIVVIFTALFAVNAHAQTGNLQAGQVWGNPAASAKPAKGTTIGAILDQSYSCNAQGDIIFRGSSLWTCLAPGTSGLPLVSQGAGADLHYAALGNSALVNASTTVNGVTCTLGSTCTISASAGSITIGTTTIASGTNTNILYNNSGVLGQYGITGTGTTAVMSASPTFTGTPVLATPTATSLALGGATIGSNALAVTGTSQFNGNVNLNSVNLTGTYSLTGTPSIAGSAINSGTVSGTYLSNINLEASGNGGVTGTLPVANGGTGSTTAAGARASTKLNIDAATSTGDANYAIQATDRMVYHTALSAARVDTLPAANAVNAGQVFYLTDFAGVVTASHTVSLARAGSDTINGSASNVIALNSQYGAAIFWSDGTSKWTFYPASAGGGSGTVTNFNVTAGNGITASSCTWTVSGTCTVSGAVTPPQGRLTLAANTPVMGANSCTGSACTNISTLRYDCAVGGSVPYYNGTNDLLDSIASCEVTTAMVSAASAGQVVASQVYDVWWEGNTNHNICIAMSASGGGGGGWASDTGGSNTSRGTGYTQLDYVTRPYITNKNSITNCFNGSTNYGAISANRATYLGTIYATANGQTTFQFGASGTSGQNALFGVFNAYNQRNFTTAVSDTTVSWAYTTNTFRQANASASNQVQYVDGLGTLSIQAHYDADITTFSSSTATNGVGIDSTSSASGRTGFTAFNSDLFSTYFGVPGAGLHKIVALEKGNSTGTTTWYGGVFMQLAVQLNGL